MDIVGQMQSGNQRQTKSTPQQITATRKSPGQICVSLSKKNSKGNSKRGKAQKHPHKKLPYRHNGRSHCVKKDVPQQIICHSNDVRLTFFFCSNALIALARSLCKCLLAVLIIASGADTVKGYLVRCACIDDTIP